MSRILKNVVDLATLTEDQPLNILFLGDGSQMDHKIIEESTKHAFYSLSQLNFACSNLFFVQEDFVINNISYNFHTIFCTNPIRHVKKGSELCSKMKIPLVLVHHQANSVKKEDMFRGAADLENFINVTTDASITDEMYLYDAIVNQDQWGEFLNEILYQKH